MRGVAWDSWAFLETLTDGPRASAVEALLDGSDYVFTVREVVAETYGFIVKRKGRAEEARAWWRALRASRIRVFEPPLDEVWDFVQGQGNLGSLSLTDCALGFVARREASASVATEDREFRRLGLVPAFARR